VWKGSKVISQRVQNKNKNFPGKKNESGGGGDRILAQAPKFLSRRVLLCQERRRTYWEDGGGSQSPTSKELDREKTWEQKKKKVRGR